jgi:uncharacterized damage-inducible protein DinB
MVGNRGLVPASGPTDSSAVGRFAADLRGIRGPAVHYSAGSYSEVTRSVIDNYERIIKTCIACGKYLTLHCTVRRMLARLCMELVDYFRRQFAYDEWANREALAAIRKHGGASAQPLQLMSHILSAERLWLERLRQQPQSLPVWPEFNVEQGEAQAAEVGRLWRDYLDDMLPAGLSQLISYKNSKGEAWSSAVQDVLTHVLMHSAYHRGQIATHMRASGHAPAYTDFIHAVRQGLIK